MTDLNIECFPEEEEELLVVDDDDDDDDSGEESDDSSQDLERETLLIFVGKDRINLSHWHEIEVTVRL